jgi:hypothetical protein
VVCNNADRRCHRETLDVLDAESGRADQSAIPLRQNSTDKPSLFNAGRRGWLENDRRIKDARESIETRTQFLPSGPGDFMFDQAIFPIRRFELESRRPAI